MKRLSPLRYPGGKGQMYDTVESLISLNGLTGKTYVEPFSGGFAIGLNLLRTGIVSRAIINDVDFHIYAFWKSVFENPGGLIKKIKETPISLEEWHNQRKIYDKCDKRTPLKLGFATLFLNRTNFSGVLKARPIGGLKQDGKYKLDCRYPKEAIAAMIKDISKFRDRVEIFNMDAECLIRDILDPRQKNLFINFDPPYVKKGKALYTNYYDENDHISLRNCIIKHLSCDWIMTYDDDNLIRESYKNFNLKEFNLSYIANQRMQGRELFISKKRYANNSGRLCG